jgi:hypothetical protein
MDHPKDYPVGYKRPPTTSQFKKGQSGNPGGRRRKSGPVRVDVESILNETFQVSVAGRVQAMSAKEVEIRHILKRANGIVFSSPAAGLRSTRLNSCCSRCAILP